MIAADMIPAVNACLDADLPVFIHGAPGIGKSQITSGIAKSRGEPLIDIRAALLDAVDVKGLPVPQNGKVEWLPMGELPDADRDGATGILFLDEVNQAPAMVQAALYGLILDRKIGKYRLPPGWRIVAAGNRISDRASAQRMPSALANRFAHFTLDSDLASWCQWAIGAGIQPELVAFIRFRPELLHSFEPDRTVNATPRSWEMADRILKASLPAEVEFSALAGTVGDGPAAELVAFLKVFRSLPSPDGVLLNPHTAQVPSDPATLFAICGALARKVTEQTMSALTGYLDRLPPEFGVLCIKDATARKPELESTPGYIQWVTANSEIYT